MKRNVGCKETKSIQKDVKVKVTLVWGSYVQKKFESNQNVITFEKNWREGSF